ncbi:MAG TPA: YIP1 family protein [Longimicrobiales bacterium]
MSEHETVSGQAEPVDRSASRWEDYIDVFFSPFELFRRRAQDRVGPPLLTLLGLAMLFYLVLLPANTMVVRSSIPAEQQPQITDNMLRIMTYAGVLTIPVYFAVSVAAAAFLLWLGGRVADLRTDFSRTMLIATYAAFVLLLLQVLGGVLVLIRGDVGLDVVRHLSFGPLRFVGSRDMDPLLMAVLRRFDLFYLWQAALWAIGLKVIYRTSLIRAGLIAAAAWLLFIIPGLISAAFNFGPGAQGG